MDLCPTRLQFVVEQFVIEWTNTISHHAQPSLDALIPCNLVVILRFPCYDLVAELHELVVELDAWQEPIKRTTLWLTADRCLLIAGTLLRDEQMKAASANFRATELRSLAR
jgi:hypothetical protein